MTLQIAVVSTPTTSSSSLAQSLSSVMRGREIVSISSSAELEKLVSSDELSVVITATDAPDGLGIRQFEELSKSYPEIVRLLIAHDELERKPNYAPGAINRIFRAGVSEFDVAKSIENSERLRSLLKEEGLTRRIASIRSLPALPKVYQQLREELQKDEASAHKIAELIKSDVGITVKVLQIVNSAFFGLKTRIESPLQAVGMLGLDTVQNLVLTAGVFAEFKDPGIPGLSLERIYHDCLEVGARTKHLTSVLGLERRDGDDAIMAGMLHAVGQVILMTEFADELRQVPTQSVSNDLEALQAQAKLLGVTHAEIGAYLLSTWGFGDNIVEAIADHYLPSRVPKPMVNGLTAVHVAYALHADESHHSGEIESTALDMKYVDALGLAPQLPYLKRVCLALG